MARTTSSISFRHFRKVSHMPESTLNFVFSYIQWNDSQAEFKRQYLLGISMPYGPAFRQFSFIYNKVSGNILDREEWHQNYLIRFGRHRSMSLGKHPLLVRPSIIDPSPPVFGLRSLDVSAASPVPRTPRLLWWILPADVVGACLIEQHVKHASSLSMVLWLDFSRTFPRLSNLTNPPPTEVTWPVHPDVRTCLPFSCYLDTEPGFLAHLVLFLFPV